MKVVFLCLALFLVICSCQDWNGRYSFESFNGNGNFVGSLYFCEAEDDDETVHGQYANIGIIVGEIDEDDDHKMRGKWFESGDYDSKCTEGEFEIELTDDGFTGTRRCTNDDFIGGTEDVLWTEVRQSTSTPTDIQCAYLHEEDTPIGVWRSDGFTGKYTICVEDDDDQDAYIASYSYVEDGSTTRGFESGVAFYDKQILSGTFSDGDSDGNSLLFVMRNGDLVNLWIQDGYTTYNNAVFGSSVYEIEDDTEPDRDECFDYKYTEYVVDSTLLFSSPSSSDASSIYYISKLLFIIQGLFLATFLI